MAKAPTQADTSPQEFPQTTPQDLYPTSDIRFVMLRIGELSTKVDLLLESAKGHGDKIDDLRLKVSFVKGAIWVLGGGLAILLIALTWYFSGKLSITVGP